jgi:hypothetical protein
MHCQDTAALKFKDISFGGIMLEIMHGCYFSVFLSIQLALPEYLDVLSIKLGENCYLLSVGVTIYDLLLLLIEETHF